MYTGVVYMWEAATQGYMRVYRVMYIKFLKLYMRMHRATKRVTQLC